MEFQMKTRYQMEDLLRIMQILRSDEGCPWDREQTHRSIRKDFLEETYEVLEAIDLENSRLLEEELGDVLLQVVFHARIEEEKGNFDFSDVVDGICKKLVQRHPHVFGDRQVKSSDEVLVNWEAIKNQEKGRNRPIDRVQSVPKTFPALMRSQKVQSRAAKSGFDYPEVGMALSDLESEVDELKQAIESQNREQMFEELGDLLFSCVNVSRLLKMDSEESLVRSCEKFIRRFSQVDKLAQDRRVDLQTASLETLNALWRDAKSACDQNFSVDNKIGRNE